jgi:FtsP/CotA-like multicopper oxidase with cupredoxin domain
MICYPAISQIKEVYITSKMTDTFEMDDGTIMPCWGFAAGSTRPIRATLPGPVLEVELGDSVIIHFTNFSPEDHTIHLHGLDVSQVYDCVPTTSVAVHANGTYDYHWKADEIGSFLYHCHVQTVMHSSLGMYGMIVVRNSNSDSTSLYTGGPGFNRERNYLTSEMFTYWNLNATSPGPFHLFDPDYFMINGNSTTQILLDSNCIVTAEVGDSILLRLANVAFSKVVYNFPEGLNPTVYTSDGRVIPVPMNIDSLEIYAGERYQIILRPDQYVEDYITVTYKRMYEDEIEGVNLIPVNINALSVAENNSVNDFELDIFPNPSDGFFELKTEKTLDDLYVNLFDVSGKFLKGWNQQGNTIDLTKLSPGVYFLEFLDDNKRVIKKAVIE